MTPRTLRRKLQKKLKHKPYIKCGHCGGRQRGHVETIRGEYFYIEYRCEQCGYGMAKIWAGGEKADTYPTPEGGRGKA